MCVLPSPQVILGLTIKEATVLSQAAIAGGALSGAAFALFRGHPEETRMPLLDFRMALVLMPVLLLGTSVGAHALTLKPHAVGYQCGCACPYPITPCLIAATCGGSCVVTGTCTRFKASSECLQNTRAFCAQKCGTEFHTVS